MKADGAVLPCLLHVYKSFTRKIKLLLIPHIGNQDGVEGTSQNTNTILWQTTRTLMWSLYEADIL
jgi:hypothetical protein